VNDVFPEPLNAQAIAERLTELSELILFDERSYRHLCNRT